MPRLGWKESAMNDLLNLAVEAHGGLKRWSKVEAVTAAASITGEIWRVKSKPDYLKNVIFKVETKRERVTMDFPGQDKRSVFEPNRIEMQRRGGTVVATRDDPEASFQAHEQFTRWMISTLRTLAERHSTANFRVADITPAVLPTLLFLSGAANAILSM
jgi:hypothetical protein